jgi:hypothetical protein
MRPARLARATGAVVLLEPDVPGCVSNEDGGGVAIGTCAVPGTLKGNVVFLKKV